MLTVHTSKVVRESLVYQDPATMKVSFSDPKRLKHVLSGDCWCNPTRVEVTC